MCSSASFPPRRGTSISRGPHAGMRATFFVSLWKREKCANQFPRDSKERKVVKRPKGGPGERGEVKANSRVVLEPSCTCAIPIRSV